MATYGLRELKNGHLSRAVKQANQGEVVTITDRGRPVAQIVPLHQSPAEARLQELAAQGRVTLRPVTPLDPPTIRMKPGRKTGVDYIREQRR